MKYDNILLFSGGFDSTAILVESVYNKEKPYCVIVDYNQPHRVEIKTAVGLCRAMGVDYEILTLPPLGKEGDIFSCRNLILLSYAKVVADRLGVGTVITGVCLNDEEGFPDCRQDFIEDTKSLLSKYYGDIVIKTPLMYINKVDTMKNLQELGFLDYVLKHTHTCYNGDSDTINKWGNGCGECNSCKCRKDSYSKFTGGR
jgi:7-cyano-7-deazaguanine synthase